MLEPAKKSDWESIRRLSVQIHDLHVGWRPDIYYHSEEPYPKDFFLEDIRDKMVYVARVNRHVAGYVVLSVIEKGGPGTVEKRQLRLDSICVDEQQRGKGIGSAMLSDVCALARAMNCTELMLGVHPENENAMRFYQKFGFAVRTINMQFNL